MDIDSPPSNSYEDLPLTPAQHASHHHINLPAFSASYPLPFRVLTLVGFEVLLWAVNLHVLNSLGVDAGSALDIEREDEDGSQGLLASLSPGIGGSGEKDLDGELLFEMNGGSTGDSTHEESARRIIRLDSPKPNMAHLRPPKSIGRGRRRKNLHKPIYKIFLTYTLWVGAGWLFFSYLTEPSGGDVMDVAGGAVGAGGGKSVRKAEREEKMDQWRWVVGLVIGGVVAGAGWRKGFVARAERMGMLRSLKRILSPPTTHAPFFADVILADILTSFAKVLGDLVVSAYQIWGGGLAEGRVRIRGMGGWVGLGMVALPYLLRLRQCLQEYFLPQQTSSRPLYNALKYASAFPVIFLSAAQRNVAKEVAEVKGMSVAELEEEMFRGRGRWFGESRVFRLWLLAVVINSMFSFWWDVTNDWGLSFLQIDTWFRLPGGTRTTGAQPSLSNIVYRNFKRLIRSLKQLGFSRGEGSGNAMGMGAEDYELSPHQRSPCPSPDPFKSPNGPINGSPQSGSGSSGAGASSTHLHPNRASHPASPILSPTTPTYHYAHHSSFFGLRPRLLFPDPLVYYLFIIIDLILRFTWSLKLSSHLHTIAEIESGVFLMEALELGRRWMWVFLRVEWEEVKRMEARRMSLMDDERERERGRGLGITGAGGGGGVGGVGGVEGDDSGSEVEFSKLELNRINGKAVEGLGLQNGGVGLTR